MSDAAAASVRCAIRVTPGAKRAIVGGSHGDALVVKVTSPAIEGRATEAALVAVAKALGLRPRAVRLVSGATSRQKVIEIEGDPGVITAEIDRLRG
ncbi:MAG: DUF167 domain-containing protein [Microthrixaceae bacterium]|nr:DUF167 domain-containing protein [Microthrixaceae bacterium]